MTDSKTEKTKQSVVDMAEYRYGEIKKVVGIISGKGGVGKSAVSALLAASSAQDGLKTGILDADITGPSIPMMYGLTKKVKSLDHILLPSESVEKIKIMSINLLLENEDDPVVWRGPLVAGTVKQFYSDVDWGDLDIMFVDLPPGTGDVPLTVMQSLPLDGVVIVATPQELVGMIVKKAIRMAELMDVPVLGVVGNMSYIECPKCHTRIELFGKNHLDDMTASTKTKLLGNLPLRPDVAALCDQGKVELVNHMHPDFFKPVWKEFYQTIHGDEN